MAKWLCNFAKGAVIMADWDDLRVFLAVARGESLSAAGRVLKLDPATVGRRIARLERSLGAGLFLRSAQGYTLTEDGARLLDHARAAETTISAALSGVKGEAGQLSGQVRIGAPDGCANFVLPQVLAQICDDHPGLDVQIVALPRVFNLSKREADLAIAVSPPTAGRLKVQKLTDYRLHLAASRGYLARSAPIVTLDDLRQHRVIGYISDMIFDRELDYAAQIGVGAPPLASNSVSVQFNWVRAGAGVAMVHAFAMPFAPELVPVLPEALTLTRSFWLIRPEEDTRLDRFTELLAQGLRAEVARLEQP